ncbi:MAG: CHC2 zinc finger domain-containing protein [Chloroflexota bacterium]
MAGSPEQRYDVDAIKRASPLVALVSGEGIRLRPAGPGKWLGLCPFHPDRQPSFTVYEEDGHFHCYGCGAHGDAIDFVMRRENVGFAEACRRLGAMATAPRRDPSPVGAERRWERLTLEEQVVMNAAAAVYQHNLWRNQRALAYLAKRGLAEWVVRACGLGYADGHSLETHLRRRCGLGVARDLGLLGGAGAGADGGPLREALAGRIVVPELRGGGCIWFIGRDPQDTPAGPKYLALGGRRPILGQERAAGRREAFLCEGVFDWLTAVAWGLPAFSPCGTHLPAERLGFLAPARVVYGVLDADAAGKAAAARFAAVLGERWRPLRLPEGSDLGDLGRRPGGRQEFFRLLAAARAERGKEGQGG